MAILGADFDFSVPGQIKDVDQATAIISLALVTESKVVIHSMEYDYLGTHDQSSRVVLSTRVSGRFWIDVDDQKAKEIMHNG